MTLAELQQIAQEHPKQMVSVIRMEKDPETGEYSRPFTVQVIAKTAYAQLTRPYAKRSQVWKRIKLNADVLSKNPAVEKVDLNPLSNPELLKALAANPEIMKALKAREKELKKSNENEPPSGGLLKEPETQNPLDNA